jgi:ribosomal protein S18 acetylase RimI-like enzyme
MNYSNRDFVGVEDLPIITAFFDKTREIVGHNQGIFLHAGDVWWRYGQIESELHQFRLWFQNDLLIALGWVTFGTDLEIQLHPNLENADFDTLAREIIDWAKRVCPGVINSESAIENTKLMRFFESCGFKPEDSKGFMFAKNLSEPIPEFELPSGFKARHVIESEFEERVYVHRDAFDPSKFSLARYARVRSMPGYKPELDLVVSNPENVFASFCLVWLSDGVGYFEPVGTRAAFRRQGLGRAVILEGFRRLSALGAHTAMVYSGTKNQAFYESCGFRIVNRFQGWSLKPESKSDF